MRAVGAGRVCNEGRFPRQLLYPAQLVARFHGESADRCLRGSRSTRYRPHIVVGKAAQPRRFRRLRDGNHRCSSASRSHGLRSLHSGRNERTARGPDDGIGRSRSLARLHAARLGISYAETLIAGSEIGTCRGRRRGGCTAMRTRSGSPAATSARPRGTSHGSRS